MRLLLLRTLHRRGNQTYVVFFKGESSDSFYLEGGHFKELDLKNDPLYLVRKTEVLNLKILFSIFFFADELDFAS